METFSVIPGNYNFIGKRYISFEQSEISVIKKPGILKEQHTPTFIYIFSAKVEEFFRNKGLRKLGKNVSVWNYIYSSKIKGRPVSPFAAFLVEIQQTF